MQRGYEIAQDPTEWDVEQKDVRQAKEDAANQVDELEDDDEEADVSTSKRKKATKEKSKKKAKVSKVSHSFSSESMICRDGIERIAVSKAKLHKRRGR